MLYQVDDSEGYYTGFAGARAGNDKDRAFDCLHGLALRFVESIHNGAALLLDKALNRLELRRIGRPHHLKKRHLQI
jgi:hypothetical protein